MTDKPAERWYDADYSENYFGWGHQDKAEFAAWVNEQQVLGGIDDAADFTADDVLWKWAEATSDRFETFSLSAFQRDTSDRPITMVMTY